MHYERGGSGDGGIRSYEERVMVPVCSVVRG
jgi:hypothetical protein